MDFEQLEYFVAVARTRRFADAAELCFISQSSVSKRIRALEREVGVRLFERGHGETKLTEAGEAFLPFATLALDRKRDVVHRLAEYGAQPRALVRLGTLPVLGAYRISGVLSDYCGLVPDVQLDLFEREQSELIRRLDIDRIDLAILRSDLLPPGRYDLLDLIVDRLVVVCPVGHPLAARREVELFELGAEPFLLMDERSALHQIVLELFDGIGIRPRSVLELARHEPLLAAVAHGIGAAILPEGLARDSHAEEVAVVPLRDAPVTTLSLATRSRDHLSRAATDLWAHFERLYGQPAGATRS